MDRKPHHKPLPDPFKEWAAKQVEAPALTPCCARCIRGTKALQGPCGLSGKCKCHDKWVERTARREPRGTR